MKTLLLRVLQTLLVLWCGRAAASKAYPTYIQDELRLAEPPRCTLCHSTEDGGAKTATQPFGITLQQLGVSGGNGRGTVTHALEESERQGRDSDGDGVIDVDELRMGGDPNLGPGAAPLVPLTGCAIASRRGDPWAFVVLMVVALLWLGRHRLGARGRVLSAVIVCCLPCGSAHASTTTDAGSARSVEPPRGLTSLGEMGLFSGMLLTDSDPALAGGTGDRSFSGIAPSLGARLALLPIAVGGIEGELDYAAARTLAGEHVSVWQLRGHALGQMPFGPVTPFAYIGVGRMRAVGPTVGDRVEAALQYGAGLKVLIEHAWILRLDVRDAVTAGGSPPAHHAEILLGFSLVLRRPRAWSG